MQLFFGHLEMGIKSPQIMCVDIIIARAVVVIFLVEYAIHEYIHLLTSPSRLRETTFEQVLTNSLVVLVLFGTFCRHPNKKKP